MCDRGPWYTLPSAEADDAAVRSRASDALSAATASRVEDAQGLVERAERHVRTRGEAAFHFDDTGSATLEVDHNTWSAGRFEAPSVDELRSRLLSAGPGTRGRLTFSVILGSGPLTDIGTLQATAPPGTLFQVASQFNCLEAPRPAVVPVAEYFSDYTQGPRASISAFPATLLRHYAAPSPEGHRFRQTTDGQQIDLLEDAVGGGCVRNGYLTGPGSAEAHEFLDRLETRSGEIRVGLHDDVQVVLGHDWMGGVPMGPSVRIAQAFTSTIAGGGYGAEETLGSEGFGRACRTLLGAAYQGTLLGALVLRKEVVVLTLIGGGVFANPLRLIWEAILYALRSTDRLHANDLHVVLNGRSLARTVDLDQEILPAVREWGGVVYEVDRRGLVAIHA